METTSKEQTQPQPLAGAIDIHADDLDTTENLLTDKQLDYAISQVMDLAQTGPHSGLSALVKHFRDLAVTGRTDEAKEDAEKCLSALAKVDFDNASRDQFLAHMRMDTGDDDTEE
jgi:hypothetical protein